MPLTLDFDLKQVVLLAGTFGPKEIQQITQAISKDFSNYRTFREAVAELEMREDQSPASNVRLGVCLFLLGRYYRALDVLRKGDGGALAHFYIAKAQFALEKYAAAIESYAAA